MAMVLDSGHAVSKSNAAASAAAVAALIRAANAARMVTQQYSPSPPPKVQGSSGRSLGGTVGTAQRITPTATSARAPAKVNTYSYGGGGGSSGSGGGGGYSGGGGGYSGGGSSGGGGGGFGGGGGGGYAPAAPVMQDITIPDANEDTDYKRTVADLGRALGDFDAQQKLSRNQYDFGWNDAKRRMGWNADTKAFDRTRPGAYQDSVYANENDFAGRGMTWSGLYGQASSDLNRDFADRLSALDTSRQDNVDTQNLARSTFVNNQDATRMAAQQNAISKIMAQFGVGASDVPTGTGSRIIQRQAIQ